MLTGSSAKADSPAKAAASAWTDELTTADAQFLSALGKRIRELREQRETTRKLLAQAANISERYLGQLESGEANVSIMLLRRIATALNITLGDIMTPEYKDSVEQKLIHRFLQQVPAHRLEDVLFRLLREVDHEQAARHQRIALLGLRGAGKTTLGGMLAQDLQLPFIELDREIERETSLPLNELFALYGQTGYRRIERRCLEKLVKEYDRAVISVGGGVVSEAETFQFLRAHCRTVWLKAKPEEHMARVIAQGDLRPMAGNDEAMEDLKRILSAREPLYGKADVIVDTSGQTLEESFTALRHLVRV